MRTLLLGTETSTRANPTWMLAPQRDLALGKSGKVRSPHPAVGETSFDKEEFDDGGSLKHTAPHRA